MFQGHYNVWWKCRLDTLLRILVEDFFQNKKVLDLGSGFGTFANMLHELGAQVTCSEGRLEHIQMIKQRYPHLTTRHEDYEVPFPNDYPFFDVILHFGVAYHLMNVEEHLLSLKDKCHYLFLDCEVIDSHDENMELIKTEKDYDKSLHGKARYRTEQYYESLLKKMGFQYIKITDKSLNTTMHRYNWTPTNSGSHFSQYSHRRLWICSKSQDVFQNCLRAMRTEITHLLEDFTPKIMNLLKDIIIPHHGLEAAMAKNKPRISLLAPQSLETSSLKLFQQNGYVIYDNRPLFADENFVNILAVKKQVADEEEFSFVIQGIKTNRNIDIMMNIAFYHGKPIDCCWNERDLKLVRFEASKMRYMNRQNIYFQSIGTLNGILQAKTKYVVKFRTDEYYSNIQGLLDAIKQMPGKLVSNNVMARKFSRLPYHISDHIIGGTRENMYLMFDSSVRFLKTSKLNGICAEQHLTRCYLESKGETCHDKDLQHTKNLMHKHFHIISIKTMGDYNVNAKTVYKFILNQDMHSEYSKFVDIESIEDMF